MRMGLSLSLTQGVSAPVDPEMFTNGTFDTGSSLAEYTASTANVSGAINGSEQLAVTNNGAGWYYRAFTTVIGAEYRFIGTFVTKAGGGRLRIGNAIGGATYEVGSLAGAYDVTFIAGTTTTYVSMGDSSGGTGVVNVYDNLSLQRT